CHDVVTRLTSSWTREAIAADGAVNQARVFGAKSGWIDATALQGGERRLIAEEDISFRQQTLQDVYTCGMIIIEGDGSFVAIGGQEICRLGADKRRAPGARLVSHPGAFHLDDVRPKIAEHHGAVGARERFRQFDDLDSVEEHVHERKL